MHSQIEAVAKLRMIREKTGMSQAAIADKLGVMQSSISRWLKDNPSMFPDRQNSQAIDDLFVEIFGEEAASDFTLNESDIHLPHARTKRRGGDVENLTIVSGAGGGGALSVEYREDGNLVDPMMSDGFWLFPDSIKSGMRNLERVKALPVIGDSMEPTIARGSTVFVDTSHTYPSPEDIYAIDYGDGLVVKRLQLIPRSDEVMVISDNQTRYEAHRIKREDVRVYGRVVAWFQWAG